MRTANWITAYSGLLIAGGYVVGSVIHTRISAATTPSTADGPMPSASALPSVSADRAALRTAALEVAAALLWAAFAYRMIDRLAPGTNQFRSFSAVGILSPRALTIWEAVALWSGLAVVCGTLVPFRRGFIKGGSGLAPAAALVLVYLPLTFFVTVASWFGVQFLLGRRRALLVTFFVAVTTEWFLSMLSTSAAGSAWGLVHGPESTLWLAVTCGALAARQSHEPDDPDRQTVADDQ